MVGIIRRRLIETTTLFVALSVQELRRLVVNLQRRRPASMAFHWAWSFWRPITRPKPNARIIEDGRRDYVELKCNCGTKSQVG